jgi:NADH:ubiquinone oxidoreductase subunit K
MTIEQVLLFITACGLVGIFLRRNLLNIIASIIQISIGITSLAGLHSDKANESEGAAYFILFFIFILIIFIYSIAILLIRRRSTLQIHELTEMRG